MPQASGHSLLLSPAFLLDVSKGLITLTMSAKLVLLLDIYTLFQQLALVLSFAKACCFYISMF